MSEPEGHRRRGPFGLLGALVLIVLVETSLARHELDFTTPPRLEWRQSSEAATEKALGSQVLALGTSMTKLGVYSALIERESGLSTYNLASCAGRLPGAYYLLRRALDSGAKPEVVLLEVHPSYLGVPYNESLIAWPDLLRPGECLDMAWAARDAKFFASTMLTRYLPSLKAREEIRVAIAAVLKGQVGSTRSNTSGHLRNLVQNDGAFVRRLPVPFNGQTDALLAGMYLSPYWSANPFNERYLNKLLRLCASRKIQVYWIIPPLSPSLQAAREQCGLDAIYTNYVKKIQGLHPEVVVLDSRASGYQVSAFSDAAHLDFSGAVAFSEDIGRSLKTRPRRVAEASNWVSLPAYRERITDAPLEDIAKSFQEAGSATVRR